MTYAYEARLTLEERNMLSVAYKNITNDLRRSWRMIDSLEILESSGEKSRSLVLIRQEKTRIERDLANICKDVAEVRVFACLGFLLRLLSIIWTRY